MSILAIAGGLSALIGIARAFVNTTGVLGSGGSSTLDTAANFLELGIDLATFIPAFRKIIDASPDAAPEVLAEAKALADQMESEYDAALADLGRRAPNS